MCVRTAGVTVGETANLKRVHFEATTLIVASLKERVASEDTESSTIKKIPPAEKRARQENQERRLSGVSIRGEVTNCWTWRTTHMNLGP